VVLQAPARPRFLVALRVSRRKRRVVAGELLGRVRQRVAWDAALADFHVLEDAVGAAARPAALKAPRTAYQDWVDKAKRPGALAAHRVRHDEPVPKWPTQSALVAASAQLEAEDAGRLGEGLKRLRDVFARRPVWQRKRLAAKDVADLTPTDLTLLLPVVASGRASANPL